MTRLTGQQIAGEGLTGWAYFYDSLETRIATPDFAAGLALVAAPHRRRARGGWPAGQ